MVCQPRFFVIIIAFFRIVIDCFLIMRDRFIIIMPFFVSAMIKETTISYLKEIIWVMLVMRNPLVLAFYHLPI